MTDLQFLPKGSITSNSNFFYKDLTTHEYDHRIKLTHEFEKKLELRHNIPIHLQSHLAFKETETGIYSAFDNAVSEASRTENYNKMKKEIVENKRTIIENIVKERDTLIGQRLEKEKKDLEEVLLRIIRDALKFSKENTPMISMMPNKLTNAINQLKEERGQALNLSSGSLNLSLKSNVSNRSVHKYESNQFLKALGLDLENLHPKNIRIDINKAYDFIKKWKVKKEDVSQVIRFKVVNEIMNVEERRSAQKIDKMNKRMSKYLEHRQLFKRQESINSISTIDKQNLSGTFNIGDRRSSLKHKKLSIIDANNLKNSKVFNKNVTQSSGVEIPSKTKQTSVIKEYPGKNSIVVNDKKKRISSKNKSKDKIKVPRAASTRSYRRRRNVKDDETKKKIVLNAYRNVDKIINHINSSEDLRENDTLVNHFNNIKYNKRLDDLTKKLVNRNKLNILEASQSK